MFAFSGQLTRFFSFLFKSRLEEKPPKDPKQSKSFIDVGKKQKKEFERYFHVNKNLIKDKYVFSSKTIGNNRKINNYIMATVSKLMKT